MCRILNCAGARPEQIPGDSKLQNHITTELERDFQNCSNPYLVPETLPYPLVSLGGYSGPVVRPRPAMGSCGLGPVPESSVGKFLCMLNLSFIF